MFVMELPLKAVHFFSFLMLNILKSTMDASAHFRKTLPQL